MGPFTLRVTECIEVDSFVLYTGKMISGELGYAKDVAVIRDDIILGVSTLYDFIKDGFSTNVVSAPGEFGFKSTSISLKLKPGDLLIGDVCVN